MNTLQPDTLIRNPQGQPVVSAVEIPRDAASTWAVVGDFAGFAAFVPALAQIEMTGTGAGALRKKLFKDGNVVVEQLNSRDDSAMYMTWTTLYNTLGVDQLWAAMRVEALAADRCRATWTIIAEPASVDPEGLPGFRRFIQDFADEAMGNVRMLLT
ncbi:SRPBCC family protein [Pseudomonas gingeri]|uniref:SRPBCC family protein n=1 Tax=Pseudomonas gingeri TaxID=117681 RepID=A0A7Y8CH94_9PSED|nr:SRPBCC family protein [Pseudomonas gingeri]NWA04996.1 SRPBCC family protein [Pseudomonas gingeri]NWA17793.1 SRPBCC family protein [Pseudomonas gingeri]NWA59235.1 SRPBCC family protein [Pseudomonas gingeri]NWA99431.1 SRPBCC family protein [Pseudomonas gingeri]NWB04653.1 SRPBCC family protein [Pseudomonas gingeri]